MRRKGHHRWFKPSLKHFCRTPSCWFASHVFGSVVPKPELNCFSDARKALAALDDTKSAQSF